LWDNELRVLQGMDEVTRRADCVVRRDRFQRNRYRGKCVQCAELVRMGEGFMGKTSRGRWVVIHELCRRIRAGLPTVLEPKSSPPVAGEPKPWEFRGSPLSEG